MPPAGSLLTPAQTAHTRILCIFLVFANEVMEEDLLKARKLGKCKFFKGIFSPFHQAIIQWKTSAAAQSKQLDSMWRKFQSNSWFLRQAGGYRWPKTRAGRRTSRGFQERQKLVLFLFVKNAEGHLIHMVQLSFHKWRLMSLVSWWNGFPSTMQS